MENFTCPYDFHNKFTIELASALIAGLEPRHHPAGSKTIAQRMRADVSEGKLSLVENQADRNEIARWLAESQLKSDYVFDLRRSVSDDQVKASSNSAPEDLPEQLDIANITYRAVSNGYGDNAATFRNRMVDYLKSNYPELSTEAVNRIATVANPDKSPGRKKFSEE